MSDTLSDTFIYDNNFIFDVRRIYDGERNFLGNFESIATDKLNTLARALVTAVHLQSDRILDSLP